MSWYITAHDQFYQSSSHISTVSDTGVRRPGYKATNEQRYSLIS